MTAPLSLNGYAIHSINLHVGHSGAWVADCQLAEAPTDLTEGSHVTLLCGEADLQGTIIEARTFGLALGARIVGGAGGWQKLVQPRGYHNDAGIKARLLADDVAREAGETLGMFEPETLRVGVDFARQVCTAASVLEYVAAPWPWWVDYAGVTHVGERPAGDVPASAYALIDFAPRSGVATLAVNALAELVPGRTLRDERLADAFVIGDLEVVSEKGSALRATAWGRNSSNTRGRLGSLFSVVVNRLVGEKLHGVYRYRVVAMRGDLRVDLQAVRASSGLPDLQAVPQWPGTPGLAAELTDGTEVLVQFVDGDRAEPLITHYAGPGSAGFAPVGIVLGDDNGQPAARQGDSVEVLIPPAVFTGTVGGAPATGVVSWLVPKADGVITGGSSKVRIAT